MVPETLTFYCPDCNVRLTVPAAFAGVTGPCPSCRSSITAPPAEKVAPAEPEPILAPEPELIPELESVPAPATIADSLPEPAAAAPVPTSVPVEPVPPLEAASEGPPASGPRIRPAPRQLPERSSPPLEAKHSTEDNYLRPREQPFSSRGARPYRVLHATFPAAFLALAAMVIYFLLYFFWPNGPGKKIRDTKAPLVVAPRLIIKPEVTLTTADSQVESPPQSTQATEEPAASPAAHDDVSPAVAANNLLEAFLYAKDAASRVDMVEPATTEAELAATLLGGTLPEVAQVFSDLPRHNPVEQRTDYPYRISFNVDGKPNVDFALLIRQRGNQPPKVFLPAFLDLVGGRLAQFTREPNDRDPAVFHVILEPVNICAETNIPNPDRKFTFRLLPSQFGKETARVYASNGSRFRTMVDEPTYPIRWGSRVRATVTIQWNRTEDPEKPFLEMIDINSPDWDS